MNTCIFIIFLVQTAVSKNYERIIVASGVGAHPNAPRIASEVIDLTNPDVKCDPLQDFSRMFATGGLLPKDKPVICGGISNEDHEKVLQNCIIIDDDPTTSTSNLVMSTERAFASSVVLSNGKLWITGGGNADNDRGLNTTEYIFSDMDDPNSGRSSILPDFGPELPYPMAGHCMALLNDLNDVLIIGGKIVDDSSGEEMISNKIFVAAPIDTNQIDEIKLQLDTKRMDHSCGVIYNDIAPLVIVAGGITREGDEFPYLDSVEIITPTINVHQKGPSLPIALRYASIISVDTGVNSNSVVILGGFKTDGFNDQLFQLNTDMTAWMILEQTLQPPRAGQISFPIPNSLTSCTSNSSISLQSSIISYLIFVLVFKLLLK